MNKEERSELCSNYGGFCKKQWVGLTEQEIKEVMSKYYCYNPRLLSFSLEIEAKLKRKNYD